MDPQNDLPDLVEDLEVNIDELTTTLAPLLDTQLTTTASSLPLLDKSKLYVLAAYSIESLLYSTLQASGVNAKEHAIFKELARLKGYFGKIKKIEERATTSAAPKTKLDVGAAARFIKHGLSGNEKYDLERAERQAKERARAHLKAQQINKKFDDEGVEKTPAAKKRDIEDVVAADPEADEEDVQEEATAPSPTEPLPKKPKFSDTQITSARRSKRGKTKLKSTETSDADAELDSQPSLSQSQETSQDSTSTSTSKSKRKQRTKKSNTNSTRSSPGEGDMEMGDNIIVQTPTATPVPVRKTRSSDVAGGSAEGSAQSTPDGGEKPKRGRGRPKKVK